MAKNTQPIAKRCKALGISPAVMGYNKKVTTRNSQQQNRRKKSEYATQLQEKQKVKFIYGVLEKQFLGYYEKAVRMPGKAGDNLLIQLESRLDNVVFRLGYAATRREARQLVNHGHYTVNGKKVNIPSYLVKAGDVIEITEKAKELNRYKDVAEITGGRICPDWLEQDLENFKGTVKSLPTRDQIDVPVDEMLIVELYSK